MKLTRLLLGLGWCGTLLSCGDPTGPASGSQYRLRTINGRGLPTSLSFAAPTGANYAVYSAAQVRFLNDSTLAYDLWNEWATVHPDSSVTYDLDGCWRNFTYRYTRHGDSLTITPTGLNSPSPLVPDFLRFHVGRLSTSWDFGDGPIELQFVAADSLDRACGLPD